MAKATSQMMALGTKAPAFTLPDPDGNSFSLESATRSSATLIMFICNHCPYVKHVRVELARIANDYTDRGVGIFGINSNDAESYPGDSPAKMKEEAATCGYRFPYLIDADQSVADAYRAVCTPEFFLFDENLKLVYRGKLDGSRPANEVPVDVLLSHGLTSELAAANVLITVLLFAILPGIALGIAGTTLVSQAMGQQNVDDAHQWTWDVAKVTVALLTFLGLPMVLIPDLVSSIFLHDPATRELARWPMRIVGLSMPIEALGFAFMHGLLGAGDARRVMLVSIGTQWFLFLPLAYLCGPVLGFGLLSVWLLQGGSRALQTTIYWRSWQRRSWQHIKL